MMKDKNYSKAEKLNLSQEMQMRLRRMVEDGVRIKIIMRYINISEDVIDQFIKKTSDF